MVHRTMKTSILFVCTANICRSPLAEGVLRRFMASAGVASRFEIDSAGTHEFRPGSPPWPEAVQAAKLRGYDITRCSARCVHAGDFDRFDYILAMDHANVKALQAMAPTHHRNKIQLLLAYSERYRGKEVPDPYKRNERAMMLALDMIEDGCRGVARLLLR
jgi:protein-tyrosine phosphatase